MNTCNYPHPLLDAVEYLAKNNTTYTEWVMITLAHSNDPHEERCAYVRQWANIAHAQKESAKKVNTGAPAGWEIIP